MTIFVGYLKVIWRSWVECFIFCCCIFSDYDDNIYLTSGGIPSSGAFVPVIHHPINTPPCDCHVHFAPPTLHKQHRAINSNEATGGSSNKPHSQRSNGVIGCVHHHHMNSVPTSWQTHAYTLPYMPATHVHQMRQPGSTKPSSRQSQHAARHKDHQKSSRQQTSPKADPTTSSS